VLIRHLSLTNFRLYARLESSLPTGPLILVGTNAQGKTSLLEALYYLATAQSPHTPSDRQLIHFLALSEAQPFARLVAEVTHGQQHRRLELRLILDPGVNGEGRFRKELLINGVKKKIGDLAGAAQVVLFLPQDLALIEGSPSDRRRYIDLTLGQVDPAYHAALNEYGKVLSQRNALLKALQEKNSTPASAEAQLEIWDEKLCAPGALIFVTRAATLADLEGWASPIHRDLTAGAANLRVAYHPAFEPLAAPEGQLGLPLSVPVHRVGVATEEIQLRFREKLRAARSEEIARGMTLTGPHRDEIRFLSDGIDLGIYGSRGQIRTAVLALKLAEMEWMKSKTGEWPVLLLDEVLAELDEHRRHDLLARLTEVGQCVLTTTDLNLFPDSFRQQATVWRISNGRLMAED